MGEISSETNYIDGFYLVSLGSHDPYTHVIWSRHYSVGYIFLISTLEEIHVAYMA